MKPRLLWADRSGSFASDSKRFFEELGFDVEVVDQAIECLLLVKAFEPDVLVVDTQLNCNGRTILDQLMDVPAFYDVPIVLMVEDERTGLTPGDRCGDSLLAAPVLDDPTVLLRAISQVISEVPPATKHSSSSYTRVGFQSAGAVAPAS